jgi:peroxiredoxin
MPLQPGDLGPDWTLMGVSGNAVAELSLKSFLDAHAAVVLHTYPLDFTGG